MPDMETTGPLSLPIGSAAAACPFSRSSSTASLDNIGVPFSSVHNSDDEDSDHKSSMSLKERRREAHTMAEQKRRDAIKKGYEDLQSLVPKCQPSQQQDSGLKISKATILQRTIDYMQYLLKEKKKDEEELVTLRKDLYALQIMKTNYEQIIRANQTQSDGVQGNCNQASDEIKFQLFQAICDSLFETFDKSLSVSNFANLSGSVIRWLEEYCKPQTLQETVVTILRQLNP